VIARVLPLGAALVLFALSVRAAPVAPIALAGLAALLLAAVAIAVPWRWLATAAACLFMADYAAALWLAAPPPDAVSAVVFGLALLLMLGGVDLACRIRGGTAGARVALVDLARGLGVGAGALGALMVATALARSFATALPAALSPLLAGAGALGAIVVLAALIRRAR
jgi:hypothetical protein